MFQQFENGGDQYLYGRYATFEDVPGEFIIEDRFTIHISNGDLVVSIGDAVDSLTQNTVIEQFTVCSNINAGWHSVTVSVEQLPIDPMLLTAGAQISATCVSETTTEVFPATSTVPNIVN